MKKKTLKLISLFMICLIVTLPIAFASETNNVVEQTTEETKDAGRSITDGAKELVDSAKDVGKELSQLQFQAETDEGVKEWDTGEAIVVNVVGYEPPSLKSNLLEDDDVPVYVFLSGLTMGSFFGLGSNVEPLYSLPDIKLVNVRPANIETQAAVKGMPRYIRPKEYSLDNLGFLAILISQVQKESDLPETIKLSMIAEIFFEDSDRMYSLFHQDLMLPEFANENQWRQASDFSSYTFFANRGAIRASNIKDRSATLTVYSGSDLLPPYTGTPRPIETLNLNVGETSNFLRIRESQGLLQNAFRVKLLDVIDPFQKRVKVMLDINGELRETILTEGARLYPGSTWTVKRIDLIKDSKNSQNRIDVSLVSSKGTDTATKIFFTSKSDVSSQASKKDPCESKQVVLSALTTEDYSAEAISNLIKTKISTLTKERSLLNLNTGKSMNPSSGQIIEKGQYINLEKIENSDVFVAYYKIDNENVRVLPTTKQGTFTLKKNVVEEVGDYTVKLNSVENEIISLEITNKLDDTKTVSSSSTEAQKFVANLKNINQEYVLCTAVEEYKKVFASFPNEVDDDGVLLVDKANFKIAEAYEWLGYPAQAMEYYQKSLSHNKGDHIIKAQSKIDQLEKDVNQGATHVIARLDDSGRNVEVKVEEILGVGEDDKPKVIVNVDGEGTKTIKQGANIFRDNLKTQHDKKTYEYNWVISKVTSNSIVVERKFSSGSELDKKSTTIGLKETYALDGKRIYVNEIETQKQALVSIIPGTGQALKSTSNFTINIPVEKRAVELNPDKIAAKINKTEKTIAKLTNIIDRFDKVLEMWKKVCIFTFLFLTIKNSFLSGTSRNVARNLVMNGKDGNDGWNRYCKENSGTNKLYSTFDKCMSNNAEKIEKTLQESQNVVEQINDEMKNLESQQWYKEIYSKYDNYDQYKGLLGKELYSKDTLRDYRYWQLMQNSESYKTNTGQKEGKGISYNFQKEVDDNLKAFEFDKSVEGFNKAVEAINSGKFPNFQSKSEQEKRVIMQDLLSQTISKKEDVKSSKFFYLTKMDVKQLATVRRVEDKIVSYSTEGEIVLNPATAKDYIVKMQDIKEKVKDSEKKLIDEHINAIQKEYNKNLAAPLLSEKGAIYKDSKNQFYVFQGSVVNQEKLKTKYDPLATVEYYPDGRPYCVPTNNGNFVKILDFFNDGTAKTIQEWNVGNDGRLCTNDDVLVKHNSVLERAESNAHYRNLLTQANKFGKKSKGDVVTTGGKKWQVSTNAAALKKDATSASCYDSMDPSDCQTLFGVCDPVLCPPSRFDLGGTWKVDNVVQTGLVGSIFLGLHNFDLPKQPVPICLTGVSAGLKSINSVLQGYVDCLKVAYTQEKTVGICDKVRSVYLCDIIWKETLALFKVKGGILKWLANKVSGTTKKAGGEYLTFQSSFDNAQKSANFFFKEYGTNAFAAFNARSTQEIGSEICKRAIYGKIPKFGELLNQMAVPEDPVQYTAILSTNPYSETQSLSQYQVYYHIYAGKTSHSPVTQSPGLLDQGGIVNQGTSGDAGIDYSVFLKNDAGQAFYITESCQGRRAFIKKGGLADHTVDCVAPSGFNQVCISINGETKCGFGKVSTSFAVNYVNDLIVQKEAERKITNEQECAPSNPSGSPGLLATAGSSAAGITPPGLVGLVSTGMDFAQTGIRRVCSVNNPGQGTNPQNFKVVGSCGTDGQGNSLGSCWIDLNSISIKDVERNEKVQEQFDEQTLARMKELAGVKNTISKEDSVKLLTQIDNLPKTSCVEMFTAYDSYMELVRASLSNEVAAKAQYNLANMIEKLARNPECSKVNPDREFKKVVIDFENEIIKIKAQFMKEGNELQQKQSGDNLIKALNNLQKEYLQKMEKLREDYKKVLDNLEKKSGQEKPIYKQKVVEIFNEYKTSLELTTKTTDEKKVEVSPAEKNSQKLECQKCHDKITQCTQSDCHGLGDYCYFYQDKTYVNGISINPFSNRCFTCAEATKCADFNFDKTRCEDDSKCAELRGFDCKFIAGFCVDGKQTNTAKVNEVEKKCSECQAGDEGVINTMFNLISGSSSCSINKCKNLGADCYFTLEKSKGECHACSTVTDCSAFNNDKANCETGNVCKDAAGLVCEWSNGKCQNVAKKDVVEKSNEEIKEEQTKKFSVNNFLQTKEHYIWPNAISSINVFGEYQPQYPSNVAKINTPEFSKQDRQNYLSQTYPTFVPTQAPTFKEGVIQATSYYTPLCEDFDGGFNSDAFKAKVRLEGYGRCGNKCYNSGLEEVPCVDYAMTAIGVDAKPRGTIAVNYIEGTQCYIPYGSYVYLKFKERSNLNGWYVATDTGGAFRGECKIDVFVGVGEKDRTEYGHLNTKDVEVWVYPMVKGEIKETEKTGLFCPKIERMDEMKKDGAINHINIFNEKYGQLTVKDSKVVASEAEQHIVTMDFLGKQIKVHKKVQDVFKCVEQKIKTDCWENGKDVYPLEKQSSYRESSSTSYQSRHFWGVAFDYNPAENIYCNNPIKELCNKCCYPNQNTCSKEEFIGSENLFDYCNRKIKCCDPIERNRYSLPQCYIDAFKYYGFKWGGEWRQEDYMHFEFQGDPDSLPSNFGQPIGV